MNSENIQDFLNLVIVVTALRNELWDVTLVNTLMYNQFYLTYHVNRIELVEIWFIDANIVYARCLSIECLNVLSIELCVKVKA